MRNTNIINEAELVVAFWDGQSNGTKDSINKAEKQNKKVLLFDSESHISLVLKKLISSNSNIEYYKIRGGKLNDEELIKFQKYKHKDFASTISREQQNRTKQR